MTAAATDTIDWAVRLARPTDMSFVFLSWLKTFRFRVKAADARPCTKCGHVARHDVSGGAAVADMHTDDYFKLQHSRIEHLLATTAHVEVLHPKSGPNVIYAWACLDSQPAVFHYVYTAEHYRKRGYAKHLVGDRAICTHVTDSRRPDSFAAWKRRAGFRYLPHLLDAA